MPGMFFASSSHCVAELTEVLKKAVGGDISCPALT